MSLNLELLCESLIRENAALRAKLEAPINRPHALGLTHTEWCIVQRLMRNAPEGVQPAELARECPQADGRSAEFALRTHMCRIRDKLGLVGIEVHRINARGYWMTSAHVKKLRELT